MLFTAEDEECKSAGCCPGIAAQDLNATHKS